MKKLFLFLMMLTFSVGVGQAFEMWVETSVADLQTGDIVVIADKTSGRAMSNDQGENVPPVATAIGLNTDKTQIVVPPENKVKWEIITYWDDPENRGLFKFRVPGTSDYLYCDNKDKGVSVGTGSNNDFTIAPLNVYFLQNYATQRYLGVYENQDWRCYEEIDNIANTEVAFYKKIYTIATAVTPSGTGEVWMLGGFQTINNVATSNPGTTVTVKLHTYSGYLVEYIVVKDADNNTIATTLTNTEGDGKTYTFVMPASDVTITGKFTAWADVYFLAGDLSNWNNGTKMTYDSETGKYRLRVFFADEYGYFRFRAGDNTYASGASGDYWPISESGNGESHFGDEITLYKGSDKRFRVPAGIYDIEVGTIYTDNWWGQTTVKVTKVAPELTFSPAAGEVISGQVVTVSSNLYDLLHAIDSSIEESAVSNQVKTDGEYAASVTINAAATVTGRAKYGNIEQTATAAYTVIESVPVTLAELVADGEVNEYYTVTDLCCVDVLDDKGDVNNLFLLCKDVDGYANSDDFNNLNVVAPQVDHTFPPTDVMTGIVNPYNNNNYCAAWTAYDQSNWILLKVNAPTVQEATTVRDLKNKILKNVTGKFTDNVNPEMVVSGIPESNGTYEYTPNNYVVSSFYGTRVLTWNNHYNDVDHTENQIAFFVQPKPNELVRVIWAYWDGSKFVNSTEGVASLTGLGLMNDNITVNTTYYDAPASNGTFKIDGVVKVNTSNKAGETYSIMPTSPIEGQSVITGVEDLNVKNVNGEIESVTYYNVSGMKSSKPFDGINIVVTRYTDGHISTSKVIK